MNRVQSTMYKEGAPHAGITGGCVACIKLMMLSQNIVLERHACAASPPYQPPIPKNKHSHISVNTDRPKRSGGILKWEVGLFHRTTACA